MVQVRLRCGMAEFGAVLHALESGSPQLFIDNLDMLSRRSYLAAGNDGGGALDVSFDLYGYLKAPARSRPRG
jgi:general secretion pathway protein M